MPRPNKSTKKSSKAKKNALKKGATKRPVAKPKPKAAARVPGKEEDFAAAFTGLKQILSGFQFELNVSVDEPRKFYLVTKASSWRGEPMFFGAVMMGKAYVSYHLMPLYVCPELVKTVPPSLQKRKQGKACFNFTAPDAALFAELSELTEAGLEKYRAKNWL